MVGLWVWVLCVWGFIGLGIVCGYGCCVRVVADVGCGVEIGVWLWRRSVCGVEILWYLNS